MDHFPGFTLGIHQYSACILESIKRFHIRKYYGSFYSHDCDNICISTMALQSAIKQEHSMSGTECSLLVMKTTHTLLFLLYSGWIYILVFTNDV